MSKANVRTKRGNWGLSPVCVLDISLSTVQKWEVGDKKPSGPSLKLLNLIERKGLEAVI